MYFSCSSLRVRSYCGMHVQKCAFNCGEHSVRAYLTTITNNVAQTQNSICSHLKVLMSRQLKTHIFSPFAVRI